MRRLIFIHFGNRTVRARGEQTARGGVASIRSQEILMTCLATAVFAASVLTSPAGSSIAGRAAQGRRLRQAGLRIHSAAPHTRVDCEDFPVEMALRPSQIRAAAEESGLLLPINANDRTRALKLPVAILAGSDDRLVDTYEQSQRLHDELPEHFSDNAQCRTHDPPDGARPSRGRNRECRKCGRNLRHDAGE